MTKTVPKVAIRKNVYDCRQMEENIEKIGFYVMIYS